MADLVERRTACMCQDVEIGSHAVSVGLKLPSHMQEYSANRVAAGLSPDIAVDACLVGEIRSLWSKGIRTYGCCCGHNKVRGMINVHEDDASAMRSMGYEQWPIEEGHHPWTFYPRSTRADVAALEAEASKGERMRAALHGIAHTFTEDDHGGMKTMSASYYQEIARAALIPEAPVRKAELAAASKAIYETKGLHLSTGRQWDSATAADRYYCQQYATAALSAIGRAPPQDNREG